MSDDDGGATLELVTLVVLVLLPILYAVVAVLQVEDAPAATRQAAREAARAFVTADTRAHALARARAAARLAFADQGLDVSPTVTFHLGTGCSGSGVPARIPPGADVTACLHTRLALPMADRLGHVVDLRAQHTFSVDTYRSALR